MKVNEGKLYTEEVFKHQRIPFEDVKGKKHTYVATRKKSSICDKCYPDSGVATNSCSRKCFGELCTLCGHYGHLSYHCMQSVHAQTGDRVKH
jgi:hypothetical protein